MHNYYRIATTVSVAFSEIDYELKQMMKTRFKTVGKYSKPYHGTSLPLTNCIAKLIGHGELMGHGFIQSPMFNLKYQLTLFLEQFLYVLRT